MSGKRAKALRKAVFGNMSQKVRRYAHVDGGRINIGLRRSYQQLKDTYKNLNCEGKRRMNQL